MTSSGSIIRNQNQEYLISLFQDQMKDLEFKRNQERQRITLELKKILPESLDSILSRQDLRLMNLYRLSPQSLSNEDKLQVEKLQANIKRWGAGGCYNLAADQEEMYRNQLYYFSNPYLDVTVCTDLHSASIHDTPLINLELELADLILNFGPEISYRYPLTSEESHKYIQRLRDVGIMPEQLPQMNFPDIESTLLTMSSL